jgi:hypothetical protein
MSVPAARSGYASDCRSPRSGATGSFEQGAMSSGCTTRRRWEQDRTDRLGGNALRSAAWRRETNRGAPIHLTRRPPPVRSGKALHSSAPRGRLRSGICRDPPSPKMCARDVLTAISHPPTQPAVSDFNQVINLAQPSVAGPVRRRAGRLDCSSWTGPFRVGDAGFEPALQACKVGRPAAAWSGPLLRPARPVPPVPPGLFRPAGGAPGPEATWHPDCFLRR